MTVWLKDLETTQTKPSITTTRTCEHTSRDAEKEISKLTPTNANSSQMKLPIRVIHWLTQAWNPMKKNCGQSQNSRHFMICIMQGASFADDKMWTFKQINTEGPGFPMGRGATKSIWRHKESYSKHTCLSLLRLRKASHDTDWHVWYRRGSCPPAEWETSVIHVKVLERLWKNKTKKKQTNKQKKTKKKLRINLKRWAIVFGLHKFSDYCYGRHVTIRSQTIRSNQQQTPKWSTKKTKEWGFQYRILTTK